MFGIKRRARIDQTTGFLARLRRDQRGNTLAMMAAMMVPLLGLAGSAIDMGRIYAVKSRLQQACDSGVLAGRKMMTDTTTSALPAVAEKSADDFFKNNFKAGWFQTESVTFTPKKTADSQVTADASAVVPLTIMKWVFQQPNKKIAVTCTARYDTADADIMFVLDTTGSMAETTSGSSSPKIDGLRTAVLSFYDSLKTSITDPSVNVRYGFVTYSSSVNVGKLLPMSYLVDKWWYQSRKLTGDQNKGYQNSSGWNPTPPVVTTQSLSKTDCLAKAGRTPAAGTYRADGTATVTTPQWDSGVCTITDQEVMPKWYYDRLPITIPSAYLTGAAVADWTKAVPGATTKWRGCIEERHTDPGANNPTDFNQNSLPADLDPDLAPVADIGSDGMPTNNDTRWRPMWPDIVYGRTAIGVDTAPTSTGPYGNNANYPNYASATCGKAAQELKVMTRSDVSNYVNAPDFTPAGNTYHDLGMIWGTRLISPTGLFYPKPLGNNDPNRYIVFMTDGVMNPGATVYSSYGIETLDQRITNGSITQQKKYHNSRYVAECTAAKRRGITVFVVAFGDDPLTSEETACATTPSKAFHADDNTALTNVFNQIAQQIATLRISQ